jgi:hypothetical protein
LRAAVKPATNSPVAALARLARLDGAQIWNMATRVVNVTWVARRSASNGVFLPFESLWAVPNCAVQFLCQVQRMHCGAHA